MKTKIEVLAKLDKEILKSAPEEELEEEMQQADEYVENIELAVRGPDIRVFGYVGGN